MRIESADGKQIIEIMHLPDRKRPQLVIQEHPNRYQTVAYFGSDEQAKRFYEYLCEMVGAIEKVADHG